MARFIISNRRAGLFQESEKLKSREQLETVYSSQFAGSSELVRDWQGPKETSRRILLLEMDPIELEEKRNRLPANVLVEPEILHYSDSALPADLADVRDRNRAKSLPQGAGSQFRINVLARGQPIQGATVTLYLHGPGSRTRDVESQTGMDGTAHFNFSDVWRVSAAIVSPVGGYWRQIVRGPRNGHTVRLNRLLRTGHTAWWHRLHGVQTYSATRGAGIRVGVVDSGIGPHPNLVHVYNEGAFIDGDHDVGGGADSGSHGTHVAGLIGARPSASGELAGISPGVDLYTARVFSPTGGANQGDIANAIDHLSGINQCDLINLSLGALDGSQIEYDAILDAFERGTLCICAVGNSGVSPLKYPAEFDETIAISALGKDDWVPDGSVSAQHYPSQLDKITRNGYYLARFSNFGTATDHTAGGVGIVSTVPAKPGYPAPYAVMDGSSMASPLACGAMAVLLSKDSRYLGMDRNLLRSEYARELIAARARDIGLDRTYQGRGVDSMQIKGQRNSYVVAVKRDYRDEVPDDWGQILYRADEVEVMGSNKLRAQIIATESAVENLKSRLGECFNIEPVVEHGSDA